MTRALLRRFRRELRERDDIHSGSTVVLTSDSGRQVNCRVVAALLRDALNDRVSVEFGPDGLLCGCREEASALRLMEYSRGVDRSVDLLGSSLTKDEMERYFKQVTGEVVEVMVPDSPERRMLAALADEFRDVKYGL